eukprot:scaffold223265_cov16-Tisochrysis_lutea.AAC.1
MAQQGLSGSCPGCPEGRLQHAPLVTPLGTTASVDADTAAVLAAAVPASFLFAAPVISGSGGGGGGGKRGMPGRGALGEGVD